ncbi:putative peptide-n4-(n-acetyl-beta-d-glucosaminyl) asparaginase amidase n [Venturia nashicola]|uniref:Putative peptide-n4-(N-acetyl-beta-d-glucosaminyl) asparaginase amidase n n=1 Tax=Venturia nashicola TaxID=86259 RepID=A0A4Z1P4N1_9PEZI|nr:putative peptide-n4-(n-acetyl-beta-d-glucosaminyl) asparaginase amidase n [Venturia nashicola]TLD22645.1 putative peptide-n4-(n-acetyl-beta-d-glucosaminyl) asparaginase amidase n [Venturia nashicola]
MSSTSWSWFLLALLSLSPSVTSRSSSSGQPVGAVHQVVSLSPRLASPSSESGPIGGAIHHAKRSVHKLTSDWQSPNQSRPILDVFQVSKPLAQVPLRPCDTQIVLMEYSFANSYGKPFVGNYTPPSCDFTNVKIEFTAKARGRQFDRLATMFLGDIEVWRTSTAEPTRAGIVFRYTKDMTPYLSLWKSPQKVIFDLGNIVNELYTSPFNTTLVASFWNEAKPPLTADLILPISKKLGSEGKPSVFNTGDANSSMSVLEILPKNTGRAVVSISANGQIDEEFWWTSVLSNDTETFPNTTGPLIGHSPFREVQLYIDGILAGVVWPFPIIFTGGVAPGLWTPIVGIDAFDLRESEIDITPFVPLLTDGRSHEFSMQIMGYDGPSSNSTSQLVLTGPYWIVSGKIFVYKSEMDTFGLGDHLPPRTTRSSLAISSSSSRVEVPGGNMTLTNGTLPSGNMTLVNATLTYSVVASRSLQIRHPVSGAIWTQDLTFSNKGQFTNFGYTQTNVQSTTGKSFSSAFNTATTFSYPLDATTTTIYPDFPRADSIKITANLSLGLVIDSNAEDGGPVSLYNLVSGPLNLNTMQTGSAMFGNLRNQSYNFGHTEQTFKQRSGGSLYTRQVKASNQTVYFDQIGVGEGIGKSLTIQR